MIWDDEMDYICLVSADNDKDIPEEPATVACKEMNKIKKPFLP